MSSLVWWNSWSSLHTCLVYGHISKSSVKDVHVKLPHKMVRDEKKLISKSTIDLSRLPVPVRFGATHPACEPPVCFVHVRGATGVDEDWPGSLATTVIMLFCPSNLAGWSTGCCWSERRWPGWSWRIRWQLWVSMKVMSDKWMVELDPLESSCQS